jgi:hypothetical protein
VARSNPPDIGAYESTSDTPAAAPAPQPTRANSNTLEDTGSLDGLSGDLALHLARLIHGGQTDPVFDITQVVDS